MWLPNICGLRSAEAAMAISTYVFQLTTSQTLMHLRSAIAPNKLERAPGVSPKKSPASPERCSATAWAPHFIPSGSTPFRKTFQIVHVFEGASSQVTNSACPFPDAAHRCSESSGAMPLLGALRAPPAPPLALEKWVRISRTGGSSARASAERCSCGSTSASTGIQPAPMNLSNPQILNPSVQGLISYRRPLSSPYSSGGIVPACEANLWASFSLMAPTKPLASFATRNFFGVSSRRRYAGKFRS
mmetsp:Transcript_64073/g.166567  ORF Transcript_64073/g.166567 Transcript_64073/m.166567 type:complete len:245 (+) Transcript_64073:678-1412(+)